MIRNQWYIVLESREVKKGQLVGVTRFGERMVFWRDTTGKLVCFKDKCVHRGASLAIGKHYGDEIACPFHGFRYDKSGKVTLIPTNGKSSEVAPYFHIQTYPLFEKFGWVFLWWGDQQSTEEPHYFSDVDENFSWASSAHLWPVHYSRAIENQLDLVHLPFVHYNTIGRGNKTLVNGPVQVIQDGSIAFWVYNERDHGQKPKKAEDLPPPDLSRQHIHFIFPNMWQNYILDNMRILVAFVPIDDSNTRIYLRVAQKFVKTPLLRRVVDRLSLFFSEIVLNQDKRVVITQLPIASQLKMEEKLIPGDLPIITYRQMRDNLLKKS